MRSPALFKRRGDRFVDALRAYADARGIPWVPFRRGERKEDVMRSRRSLVDARVAALLSVRLRRRR